MSIDGKTPATAAPSGDHLGTFIGGSWLERESSFDSVDPATGEAFGQISASEVADVDRAVAAARAAARDWARTSPSERGAILGRWAGLVFQNQDRLAALEARDVGKPLSGGLLNVQIAGSILQFTAGAADKLTGATLPTRSPDYFGFTRREPHGVCAIVLPWNVPAVLGAANLAPALAAGNTVVLKPSEVAPLVIHALVELGEEAGLPPGVLNVLTGVGAELGATLVGHPGVDHISFVGSVATGRLVMQAAAQNLTPLKVELGGKSPNLVFADADLDVAVPAIVRSITENAGQNCNAGSRLLVHADVADDVRSRVVAAMAEVRIGAWHEDLDMGPLVNAVQHARVSGLVSSALGDGVELLLGGGRPSGHADGSFLAPTVLSVTDRTAPIVGQEIFGPVLTVETFTDDADALALANGTDFGLLACIWTGDVSRALRMAGEIGAGQVSVNQFSDAGVIGMPFNMAKQSGFSSGNGYRGMYEFTREKAVAVKLLG
ncbi:aldehyde dehydrogenase family protein [Nocardioides nitrophenolicus]|uniref:aldehyde dehydrogenase family protein n=1 Tax=Nocardioides nitrophenolicus TaxID=60489 RepID=UPI0019567D67|nr:aldehyde dehydrogenase family protein [Nocardioides nitrophenolicus]MBM7517001.1 aldehyde dehydrogenase (NAD+) [Nocardioides nitrophenolicus]